MHRHHHTGPKFEELSDGEDDYNHGNVRYEDPDDHDRTRSRNNTNRASNSNRDHRRMDDRFNSNRNDVMTSFFDNDPFFSNPFGMMSSMMKRSEQMFERMNHEFDHQFNQSISNGSNNGNNYTCYSSSKTITSSNGITKTKERVKDSRTGTDKISVTKQVGDKKSITEKTKDLKSGQEKVFKKLENVSKEEDFEKEWKQASKHLPKVKSSLHYDHPSLTGQSRQSSRGNVASLNYEKKR